MYNPEKITELLKKSGVTNKTLLDYLGMNYNGSLNNIIKGDIRVSKIEKIADFFGVPIDTFFDREPQSSSVQVGGIRNHVHDFNKSADTKIIRQLIEEKDKRIALLEEMLAIYKNSEPTK